MEILTESHDDIVTITMDDGAKNALDVEAFSRLTAAFDGQPDARAFVLTGREDIFSAGLDLKIFRSGDPDAVHELVTALGAASMRIWVEHRPVVVAATGHAVAGGTMLAMAADHAVAAEGDFVWGLTETQIGFVMPRYGIVLAHHNVPAHRLEDLLLRGRTLSPAEAVDVGFADELAPADQVLARARQVASELAELPASAYAGTKRRLRGADADAVLAHLDDDIRMIIDGWGGPDG